MVDAFFLDTSALVKKYMTETGSTWIETLTDIPYAPMIASN